MFTVEGYFTIADDTSDFYERNTGRKWAVSKLGFYDEAESSYKKMATEKYEGIYLKALGYAVSHVDNNGNETDALVFRKILKTGHSDEEDN